jgi:HD-like signal output (HDOD) protein/DNA-binding NarL/FixJ family response regulator
MLRVLIIDDDELTRERLSGALRAAGVQCESAASAPQGLRLLRAGGFDGVLLDVEMEPFDGVVCLGAIRADASLRALPVIMMSLAVNRSLVVRVAALGVRGLVLKNASFLKTVVQRVFEFTHQDAALCPTDRGTAAAEPIPATTPPAASTPATPTTPTSPTSQATQAMPAVAVNSASPVVRAPMRTPAPAAGLSLPQHPTTAEALEALKSLKPIIGRQELLDRVLSGNELRVMGPAARQALSLTGSDSGSVDAVARAIRQDQAMSLRILKLANSPLYRRGTAVDSVAKAVARIGTSQIRQTILAMSVMDQFKNPGVAGRLRADRFWEHCIATGLVAAGLARARGCAGERADAMFTAGLLHDVGRMLFVERLGDVYAGVLDVADKLRLPLEAVETRLLLVNHADVTDRLMREWTFPADLVAPIAYHHLSVGNIRSTAPRALPEAATLALANRLAHCVGWGSSGNDVLYPTEEFVAALGLSTGVVASVCAEAAEQFTDVRATMLLHSGEAAGEEGGTARGGLGAVRACCLAREPAINPAEPALRRMGVLAGSETPSVLVVRVCAPGERAALREQAQAVCAQHSLEAVPVLVLANSQACFFEAGAFGGAPVEQFLLPLQMERLEQSLIKLTSAGGSAALAAA